MRFKVQVGEPKLFYFRRKFGVSCSPKLLVSLKNSATSRVWCIGFFHFPISATPETVDVKFPAGHTAGDIGFI